MMFCEVYSEKKLISPTKLSNLGMIKSSTPSKIIPQRSVHPTKKNMKNALLRRVWPSNQLFTFPFPSWDPLYQIFTPNIKRNQEKKTPVGTEKDEKLSWGIIAQKINT